jgi:hypothetical protein
VEVHSARERLAAMEAAAAAYAGTRSADAAAAAQTALEQRRYAERSFRRGGD